MTRGILYLVWGSYDKSLLKRSTDSAEKYGYDYVVRELDVSGGLDNKRFIYDQSPYDITLFLDIDTVITGNLDFGFEMAERYGLACCLAPASSAWLASPKSFRKEIDYDLPQLNTGVIFFNKNNGLIEMPGSDGYEFRNWVGEFYGWGVPVVFYEWERLLERHPESSTNDQPFFSKAVYDNLNPFILPRTWNWRREIRYESKVIHGDLKILHSKR